MREPRPCCSSTAVAGPERLTWIPQSMVDLLAEIDHLRTRCSGDDPLPLFRGQREARWLLDSTFARAVKATVFGLPVGTRFGDDVRLSAELHLALLHLWFLKLRVARPHRDLLQLEETIDPWFEFFKRIQQFPQEDHPQLRDRLGGSFLMDWTISSGVGLYFASEASEADGALWICDAGATGKTLQTITVEEVLKKMLEEGMEMNALGVPLLFSPPQQIAYSRAERQEAVYFAQMDLRVDLEEIWRKVETERQERIIVKVIVKEDLKRECRDHLRELGVTREYLFPDEAS